MATYLIDTNLLLRLADPESLQHSAATLALARLLGQGDEVYVTPQNFIEFWAVATRPVEANGFGWNGERTVQEVTEMRRRFPMLPIRGKRVHDARLAAVLEAHAIDHLITFNTTDFTVFPSLSLIDPRLLITATGE